MRLFLIFSLIVLVMIISSCSTNENDPLEPDSPDGDVLTLVASASEVYFISLSQRSMVDVVDHMLEDSWDISIDNLTNITVNGGSTAPGKVYVQSIENENYSRITVAPDGMYNTDTHKNGPAIGENWYFYDVNTHTVSPLDLVYIIKTGNGEYYKFRISESVFTSRTDGEIKFLMDKISAPSAPEFMDPSGRVRTALLSLSASKSTYFQLKEGEIVDVSDPTGSNDWDIRSDYVTLSMNCGTSGSGQAGAIKDEDTPIDEIANAPADGYAVDDSTEAIMAIGDAWYNYDLMTHALAPHPYSWVVKTALGKYAKIEFVKTVFYGQSDGVAVIRFMYLESGNQF